MANEQRQLEEQLQIGYDQYDTDWNDRGQLTSLTLFNGEWTDWKAPENLFYILSGFPSLEYLEICVDCSQVEDLSPITSLRQLTFFSIEEPSRITDITCLRQLINLEKLHIANACITDVNCLADLRKLTSVSLQGNQISRADALFTLEALEQLDLSCNVLTSISGIEACRRLFSLNISANQLKDLSMLGELPDLRHLMFNNNQVQDISFLERINQLTSLYLTGNQLATGASIACQSRLKTLHINDNLLTDLEFLSAIPGLEYLNISHNPVVTLSPRYFAATLVNLDADQIGNFDTSAITPAQLLSVLSLAGCGINDISFLKNHQALKYVNLNNNAIQHIYPIIENRRLKHIYLQNNPIFSPFPVYAFYQPELIDLQGVPFGGKLFVRYVSDADKDNNMGTIEKLREQVGLHYAHARMYDEALGYYFIAQRVPIRAEYQIKRLEQMNRSDLFYLKYCLIDCIGLFHGSDKLRDEQDIESFRQRLHRVIDELPEDDSVRFRDSLSRSEVHHKLYKELIIEFIDRYQHKHYPVIIYNLALARMNRDGLSKCIYVYRQLRSAGHPLQYALYQKIMHVLGMNFASTDSERASFGTHFNHLHYASDGYQYPVNYADFSKYLPFRHEVAQVATTMVKSSDSRLLVFVLFLTVFSILGVLILMGILISLIFFRPA